ncbi:MAG: ABC transporter permease [Firmicutes bacterium]|nr:ABC transporter permease [Bacillota bacterium]
MAKLVKFELHKLFRQKSFYIIMILIAGVAFLTTFVTRKALNWTGFGIEGMEGLPVDSLKAAIHARFFLLEGIENSAFSTFLVVFASIFVCMDYVEKTAKNIAAKGYTRMQILFSKYFVTLIGTLLLTLVMWGANFGFGALYGGIPKEWPAIVFAALGTQLMGVLGLVTAYFFLSQWVRKTGAAIALGIILPTVVALLLELLEILLKIPNKITPYWLSTCLQSISEDIDGLTWKNITRTLMVSCGYIAGFLLLSTLVASKRDV